SAPPLVRGVRGSHDRRTCPVRFGSGRDLTVIGPSVISPINTGRSDYLLDRATVSDPNSRHPFDIDETSFDIEQTSFDIRISSIELPSPRFTAGLPGLA